MPASVPIVSSLLPLVLVSILSTTHGQDVGESCVINNSAGVCKIVDDCPPVYQELLAGRMPSKTCGFLGFDPIVCCPTTNSQVTKPTPASPEPTKRRNTSRPLTLESRGSVARARCAENAKAVYGLVLPPTPTLNRKPVNTSLCVLDGRKLIVGGKKADAKEFPHMTAVGFGPYNNIQWLCGGSLISARIVLTAAHCTWTSDWGSANWVRVGDLNLVQTNDNAMPQTIAVEERIRHPDYKRPSQYHDIAILRLEEDATFNAYVRPACLPVDWPDVGRNDKAIATGWGLVDWTEDTGSDNLLKVTLKLVSHASCNASFFDGGNSVELPFGIDNDWQICAGEVGKDTCQGDSGGPLSVFNTDHYCMYNVIGVTSLGRLCGSIIPGVYTRVYHYIPWIERTAWPEDFLIKDASKCASERTDYVIGFFVSVIIDPISGARTHAESCGMGFKRLSVVRLSYFFHKVTNQLIYREVHYEITLWFIISTVEGMNELGGDRKNLKRMERTGSRMPASVPIVSSLLLLVLVSILSVTREQNVGESCVSNNSTGVCRLLDDCPQVYQELLAGKTFRQICGYFGFDPIMCCPTTNTPAVTTPAPQPKPTTRTNTSSSRGSVARARCAENAKAVYGLVLPPTPTLDRKPINVSLCALTTRKLIIGGRTADLKEFPHMAAVGFGDRNNIEWRCGGSLISARIVLTGASCAGPSQLGNATWVRLGDVNLVQTNDYAISQTIAIKEKIIHPDYKRPLQYHNIALLRLEEDATYNAYVRPACLPVDWPDVGQNDVAVATGWGKTDWAEDEGSDRLLKVSLKLVPHVSCNASYFEDNSTQLPLGIVDNWQICAGETGKDTCQGDSGGPLTVFNTDHECMYNVIGITSFGRLCGSIPGVYTRVYHYIPWIERTAWPEDF
ncbi:uncharacterized protein LOC105193145 [Solenopsis invicta]|uniref:uncharacterized protein LOC105193145 n=1 Tax=Solenopsis invicta TaxID=13686 RepID=UPI00193E92D1|nr:uncharacterized protein LOC105193145 [Solenopsis invicta]